MSTDSSQSALDDFAKRLMEAVAMAADENAVGVDGDEDTYDKWREALHIAVDDGLEAAERRARLLPEGR